MLLLGLLLYAGFRSLTGLAASCLLDIPLSSPKLCSSPSQRYAKSAQGIATMVGGLPQRKQTSWEP